MRARMVEESLLDFESLSTIESMYEGDMFGKLLDLMEISNTRTCVDNFYVNVDLFNNQTANNGLGLVPTSAKAEQAINYNTPLLDDPSKYSVAIEKATIPMNKVPLFRRSQRSLILWIRSAGFETSMLNYSSGYPDDEVYFVHTILDKINVDIIAHYTKIGVAVANAPYFVFNPVSGLFEYHLPSELEYTRCQMSFSADLYNMFNGFNFKEEDGFGMREFNPITQNFMRAPKDSYGHMVYSQEFSSIGNWSDVDTILVTTNLPVVPEATGSFDSDTQGGSSMNILTDLSINSGSIMGSRGDVMLVPNYRREIKLLPGSSIYSFKIKFWYRTKKGEVRELMIPYGSHMSAKLVFKRNR